MTDQDGSAPERRRGLPGWVARVAFEFLVVFIGVLAALYVDAYQEGKAAHEGARRVAGAVRLEMQRALANSGPALDSIRAEYGMWRDRQDRGARQAPYYVRVGGSLVGSSSAWDAALASDILEVLSPELVVEIGSFYDYRARTRSQVARYTESVEQVIYPYLGAPPGQFYDSTGELRPEIKGNLVLLDELLATLADDQQWMRYLVDEIAKALPEER